MKSFPCIIENLVLILSINTLTFCLDSKSRILNSSASSQTQKPKLNYILQWETINKEPLILGQQAFIDRNCTHTNCYIITTERGMPKGADYTKYDVILFGPDLTNISMDSLPKRRSPHQKYVFISSEASDRYPLKVRIFDGYFNWTWTYRLDSDLMWGSPFVVKTLNRHVVAPKNDTEEWVKEPNMPSIQNEVKYAIRFKRRAVAYFVSDCDTASGRERQVEELKRILNSKYSLHVDIYGKCGPYECPKEVGETCDEFIRDIYFFYLAYEKTLSEDFVSDQLLHAVQYYTVPVVYGGANYNRFLPDNSYIDAMEMSTEALAGKINEAVRNSSIYRKYLKWNFFYSYHSTEESPETDDYCRMCALLNDKKKFRQLTTHQNFTSWWTLQHKKPPIIETQRNEIQQTPQTLIRTIPIMHPVYIDPDDGNWFLTLYKDAKTLAKTEARKGISKLRDRFFRILGMKPK